MNIKGSSGQFGMMNFAVVVLSIYVLLAMLIDTVFTISSETSLLLQYIDNGICGFFFIEFSIRFVKSREKLKFMKWGWIDLVSCVPMIDFLRAGRLLRLIKLLRILRAFRSVNQFVNHVFANKAQGAFASMTLIAVLLVIFSAISILQFETDPNSNIKTAEDAIWWAYVTITTVGYGDKFPVTTEGRIIASILMTAGVGLFGTYTAYVGSWFLTKPATVELEKED